MIKLTVVSLNVSTSKVPTNTTKHSIHLVDRASCRYICADAWGYRHRVPLQLWR